MKPTRKAEPLERFLEEVFGRTTAIESDTCVTCGQRVVGFKDELSLKEYRISGMCQVCQDSVFGS